MPDISVGRRFSTYLKKNAPEFIAQRRTYRHSFPEAHRPYVDAAMYPLAALPLFIRYIHDVWVPNCGHDYFKQRDPMALDYLPKLLGA